MTIDDFLGTAGEGLYHYTSLAAALEHIVPTRQLRLSPFSSMRDPRESRSWAITGGGHRATEEDADSLREDTLLWIEFNSELQERKRLIKVFSLTRDDSRERDWRSAVFGRGFAHPRLWEQYADNHHGVCLCFDLGKLIDEMGAAVTAAERLDHDAVVYADAEIVADALHVSMEELRAHGVSATVTKHVREHIGELFFTKLRDWETEMEYRFVVETDHPDPIYVNVRRALRAVILGAEVSGFYEPAFSALCDPAAIAILRMNWVHARPHLAKIGTPPEPTLGLDNIVFQAAGES
jgi:hypothetical protein